VTERPSDNGVPLRAVIALGLAASFLSRGIAPALPGVTVGLETVILWAGRLGSLLTLLAATGLVAGIARLATAVVGSPRAPLVARLVAVPAVSLGCMLLLFASFRPLEPVLALILGVSAAVVGALSARHSLGMRDRRAGALVLGLTSTAGLIHVVARKLALDASEAASINVFRVAQLSETLAVLFDIAALGLALLWLQRRAKRGRIVVPLVLVGSMLGAALVLRGSAPSANTLTVLLSRSLEPFLRGPSPLLPVPLGHALSIGSLLTAAAALGSGAGDIGLVLAAALAARGAFDIPVPALMLELGALYLPFARATPAPAPASPSAPAHGDGEAPTVEKATSARPSDEATLPHSDDIP
jgi:hypothetical protein